MLTKPPIADAAIITHLRDAYAIDAADLAFLPIGADADSAVYRATTREGRAYFVKLRRGPFDDLPIRVPWFLHQHGVKHVIPPPAHKGCGLRSRVHSACSVRGGVRTLRGGPRPPVG